MAFGKLMMEAKRLESMSPDGFLSLYRAKDCDILIQVAQGEQNTGSINRVSSIEFCTPMSWRG